MFSGGIEKGHLVVWLNKHIFSYSSDFLEFVINILYIASQTSK